MRSLLGSTRVAANSGDDHTKKRNHDRMSCAVVARASLLGTPQDTRKCKAFGALISTGRSYHMHDNFEETSAGIGKQT